MSADWIDLLNAKLAAAPTFAGCVLKHATAHDEPALYALHRAAMRDYVDATWGWDESWQRTHFAREYDPAYNALIVREGGSKHHGGDRGEVAGKLDGNIGRISLTRHWRKIFLRDIELVAAERDHGLGTTLIDAVIAMARSEKRYVELYVLDRNPALHLYLRLGFRLIDDDGARHRMRAD